MLVENTDALRNEMGCQSQVTLSQLTPLIVENSAPEAVISLCSVRRPKRTNKLSPEPLDYIANEFM
ncbi:hypothetical protein [Pantoea stewartii]|uniref:hypothetical protein n=1 Tax=Pantoea stewartii TaxID=66269 RepID=UPI00249F2A79|nr:hypothetical protein [Pantoea stewartii]